MDLAYQIMYLNKAKDLKEANAIIREMRNRVKKGENPVDVLSEWGLDSKYVLDLY